MFIMPCLLRLFFILSCEWDMNAYNVTWLKKKKVWSPTEMVLPDGCVYCSKVAVIIIKEGKKHGVIKTTSYSRTWACPGLLGDKEEQVCQTQNWANRANTKMGGGSTRYKKAISPLHHINSIQIFMCQF